MFKSKKLILWVLFIFLLACPFSIPAMEDEDTWGGMATPSSSSGLALEPSNPSQPAIGNKDLDTLFSPIVSRVPVQPPLKRIGAALCSLFPAFPSFQVGVPIAITCLKDLGLNKDVIPDEGPASALLASGVFVTPLIVGGMAAYEGVMNALETSEPGVITAQKTTTERSHSRLEYVTHSYFIQTIQMLVLGGLVFAFILNTESNVSGWGDPLIWGCVFGAAALPIIYALFVRSTNNPNRSPFRSYTTENEKTEKEECLRPIVAAKEVIRHQGLTSTEGLGKTLMVIESDIRSNTSIQLEEASSLLHEDESSSSDFRETGEKLPHDRTKLKYLAALEQMKVIQANLPSELHLWNSKLAKWGSLFIQSAGLPMKGVISYVLLDKLFTLCTLSPEASMWASIGTTAVAGIPLALASFKEAPLTYKELKQFLHLYRPEKGCNFWGQRIAPLYARGAALIYFTLPLVEYLKDEILEKGLGITNSTGQMFLIVPFAAATLLPASAQFFDHYLTKLSNWIATGGNVGCCKIFSCLDPKNKRKNALKILERLQKFEEQVMDLNPRYTTILRDELTEDTTLLATEGSVLL